MMRIMICLQIAYSESYLQTKLIIIKRKVVPMSLVKQYAMRTCRGAEA
jgi:hypothetical protein